MKIGFALITSSPFFYNIIAIENKINKEAAFFDTLGSNVNIPHTTIFQGDMRNDIDYKNIANDIAEIFNELIPNKKIAFNDFVYVPDGWYFLECVKTDMLQNLHQFTLENVKKYIILDPNRLSRNIKSLSKIEIDAIKEYGYRYAGDAFYPHITIGRSCCKSEKILDFLNAQKEMLSNSASISGITVYAMGNNGTHHKTLYEVIL